MFNLNLKPHFLHEILHDARQNKNLFSLFCFRGEFFFFFRSLLSVSRSRERFVLITFDSELSEKAKIKKKMVKRKH